MSQPIPSKPIIVERFDNAETLEAYLNVVAKTPGNRYDLKFFTHIPPSNFTKGIYTIVLCWTPEDQK